MGGLGWVVFDYLEWFGGENQRMVWLFGAVGLVGGIWAGRGGEVGRASPGSWCGLGGQGGKAG